MRAVRFLFLQAAALALLGLAAAVHAEEGGRPPSLSVELYKEWVKYKYLPKKQEQYNDKKKEVDDLVKEMSKAQDGDSGKRFTNFHGADLGTFLMTQLTDTLKYAFEFVFERANNFLMTRVQINRPQQLMVLTPLTSTFHTCEIRSQLPPGLLGYADWGTCVNMILPGPPFCLGKIVFTSSLVEYYYPGYKADVSEEPYQSYYYLKPLIEGGIMKLNEQILYKLGKEFIPDTINMVHQIANIQGSVYGYDFGTTEAQANNEAMDYLTKVDQKLRHTSPHLTRAYGRLVSDPVNFASLQLRWMPHVMKAPLYGGDLPLSLGGTGEPNPRDPKLGGIFFSRIFFMSMPWQKRFFNLIMPLGPMRCMSNNKSSGKTPKDFLGLMPPPRNDDTGACLKDIGEVFPMYDHRRQHITDGTYQGIWRALEIYRGLFPEGGSQLGKTVDNEIASGDAWAATRHTFKRDMDKWLVLRNEELEKETPSLRPFDELYKLDVTYDKANLKAIGSGGENSFLVLPIFKGCWGVNTFTAQWEKGLRPGIAAVPFLSPKFVKRLPHRLPPTEIRLY